MSTITTSISLSFQKGKQLSPINMCCYIQETFFGKFFTQLNSYLKFNCLLELIIVKSVYGYLHRIIVGLYLEYDNGTWLHKNWYYDRYDKHLSKSCLKTLIPSDLIRTGNIGNPIPWCCEMGIPLIMTKGKGGKVWPSNLRFMERKTGLVKYKWTNAKEWQPTLKGKEIVQL